MRTDFDEHFLQVGGVGFDDIVAKNSAPLTLPLYLPQVRWRPGHQHEQISAPLIGVRLHEVLRRGGIRTAAQLRTYLGLDTSTKLVLLLFSPDQVLEQLAANWDQRLGEIASGGWQLVLPPSFSLWEPQRRPDNLLSLRRSMLTFAALQNRGVETIPRVGWVEPIDMERLARWVNQNPFVETVTLDLQTYAPSSFARSVALLAAFDALTGERLRYLVNGVKTYRRIAELYLATAPDRVTITEATMARLPAGSTRNDRRLAARSAEVEERCLLVRQLIGEADRGLDVEELLGRLREKSLTRDSRPLAA